MAYAQRRKMYHPDNLETGNHDKFVELEPAYFEILQILKKKP